MQPDKFQVSVIIPVYNAESFVEKAVKSALGIQEVGEIILIEDNSRDNSFKICCELSKNFEKVKFYYHSNRVNKGAAASRNLGISKAKCPFIAFLDADDWYLPYRFGKDKKVFSKKPEADALCSYTMIEGENFSSLKRKKEMMERSVGKERPGELYEFLAVNQFPFIFNTNSITLKKSFLVEDKLFDCRLDLHQDSELWSRLMRRGVFVIGETNLPLAVVRRHEQNRITSRNLDSRLKMLTVFIKNVGINDLYKFEKKNLLRTILRAQSKKYANVWVRRFFFYIQYFRYWFCKEYFLQKIVDRF